MQRLLPGVLVLALLLTAGCTLAPRSVGDPCWYAGSVVEVTYPTALDLGEVRDALVSLGWKQRDTGASPFITGMLEFADVSAMHVDSGTRLSALVLRPQNAYNHAADDQEAEAVLRRVKARVEVALGLPPTDSLVHRENIGCRE